MSDALLVANDIGTPDEERSVGAADDFHFLLRPPGQGLSAPVMCATGFIALPRSKRFAPVISMGLAPVVSPSSIRVDHFHAALLRGVDRHAVRQLQARCGQPVPLKDRDGWAAVRSLAPPNTAPPRMLASSANHEQIARSATHTGAHQDNHQGNTSAACPRRRPSSAIPTDTPAALTSRSGRRARSADAANGASASSTSWRKGCARLS